MLKIIKGVFVETDERPTVFSTMMMAVIAAGGHGGWAYVCAFAVMCIGMWSLVTTTSEGVDQKLLPRLHRDLAWGWLLGLTGASFAANNYRSAFFMSAAAVALPLALLAYRYARAAAAAEEPQVCEQPESTQGQ